MKKLWGYIVLLLTMHTHFAISQEVSMNETLKLYEYSHEKSFNSNIDSRIDVFSDKMRTLSYTEIDKDTDFIKGQNFFTKMIFGSAMEVHYNSFIQFKEGIYKLTINNFRVKDERYGTVAIETLAKASQKRWVKFINEQLPQVVTNLENTETW